MYARLVSFFRLVGESRKANGVIYCDIGENFAIQIDAGLLQTADESAVGKTNLAARRIDAHNPQRPKIALLEAASNVSIFEGFLDGFLSRSIKLRLCKKKTLCPSKGLVAVIPPVSSSFYSWHVFSF